MFHVAEVPAANCGLHLPSVDAIKTNRCEPTEEHTVGLDPAGPGIKTPTSVGPEADNEYTFNTKKTGMI